MIRIDVSLSIGKLVFVHAGIDPHDDLDAFLSMRPVVVPPDHRHWAWIERAFLTWRGGFGGRVIEDHLGQLDQQMADLLTAHHDAVQCLAEVPGLGVDSAQQINAAVGATAATFPSPEHLASCTSACGTRNAGRRSAPRRRRCGHAR